MTASSPSRRPSVEHSAAPGGAAPRNYSFHEVVDNLALARAHARHPFDIVVLPSTSRGIARFPKPIRPAAHPIMAAVKHAELALSLLRRSRALSSTILLRDFLTIPFAVTAPLFWPLRRRLVLIDIHNVQRATTSRAHRRALRLILRLGFTVATLEDGAGLSKVAPGLSADRRLCLPIPVVPVGAVPVGSGARSSSRLTVGVIGNIRPEKGTHSALTPLQALSAEMGFELLLGSPNAAATLSEYAGRDDIAIVDTTAPADFAAALTRSDIVILSYRQEDYRYRTSGVLTNALECGAIVVCPSLPTFEEQVTNPKPVGVTYGDPQHLAEALRQAIANLPILRANLPDYHAHRSPRALGEAIDAFTELRKDIAA